MEIDLRKTWCIANVPNHDKLRLLGYDLKPVGSHRCGDYYYMLNSNEVYDSTVFNKDFKQIELNELNEFVYVENTENIVELNEFDEFDNFTKYGFETPEFECKLYDKIEDIIYGVYYNRNKGKWTQCRWTLQGINKQGSSFYHLKPINKPWYETCKFPCLVKDESVVPIISIISASENYSTSYLDLFTPLTNEEIEGLKQ